MGQPRLALVIPCYNEREVLPLMGPRFVEKLRQLVGKGLCGKGSSVVFVNDGSSDDTWQIILKLHSEYPEVEGVCLSRNRGHQNALLCGLHQVALEGFDASISIDCDGQDSLDAMDEMLERYAEGFEVVYGVRSSRETDTWFKRTTAQGFYKLLSSMGVECVYNHADYRLLSLQAMRALCSYSEVNLFLRGMVPLVGYRSTQVEYARAERVAGESHYPLSKMIHLAVDGITSLSIEPIRLITKTGLATVAFALLLLLIGVTPFGKALASATSRLLLTLFLLCGAQLVAIGVVGEYVGKAYMETKSRPRWVVSESTLGKIAWDGARGDRAGDAS